MIHGHSQNHYHFPLHVFYLNLYLWHSFKVEIVMLICLFLVIVHFRSRFYQCIKNSYLLFKFDFSSMTLVSIMFSLSHLLKLWLIDSKLVAYYYFCLPIYILFYLISQFLFLLNVKFTIIRDCFHPDSLYLDFIPHYPLQRIYLICHILLSMAS